MEGIGPAPRFGAEKERKKAESKTGLDNGTGDAMSTGYHNARIGLAMPVTTDKEVEIRTLM